MLLCDKRSIEANSRSNIYYLLGFTELSFRKLR